MAERDDAREDEADTGDDSTTRYRCRGCKHQAQRKWEGPCPGCGFWFNAVKRGRDNGGKVISLADAANVKPKVYIPTGVEAFDRVVGDGRQSGIVPGSVYLLGGPKGLGKSTLLVQVADGFARDGRKALFAAGEQGSEEVLQIAQRIGCSTNTDVRLEVNPKGLDIEDVREIADEMNPDLVILDSIQVCHFTDIDADFGSAAQVDALADFLNSWAKEKQRKGKRVAFIVIGHLTKSGDFAGTEKLLHLVDVLMRFDEDPTFDDYGDPVDGTQDVRVLCIADKKNRNGRNDIVAHVEMTEEGLRPLSRKLRKHYGPKLELVER